MRATSAPPKAAAIARTASEELRAEHASYLPPRPPLVPHAHAICRSCGRITDLPLRPTEPELLKALADGRPVGWLADGITFSVTGTCPTCRATRARSFGPTG